MSFRPTMMALQRIKPATPYRSLRARVKAAEKQELQANTSPTPPKNPFGLQSGSTGSQSSRSRARKVMNVFDKTRLVSEDVREMSGIVEPNQVVKYRVIRTGSGHLPVYIEKSNNGRVQTIVRKIEGDSYSMRDHLNTYLQNMHVDPVTAPPQARVKPTNQHLILKGRVDEEIKSWLEQMGY